MGKSIKLEGGEALDAALKTLGDRTTGLLLKEAAEAGARVIAEEARTLAPKRTGKLAAGIDVQPERMQQGRAQFGISFNKRQWYGSLLELGTKKMVAKPFLRPALDTKAKDAQEAVWAVLRNALKGLL